MLRAPSEIRLQVVQELRHLRRDHRGFRGFLQRHQGLNMHSQNVREELCEILADLAPNIRFISARMQLVARTFRHEPSVRQAGQTRVRFEHEEQRGQRTQRGGLKHQSQLQRTNTEQREAENTNTQR